MKKVNRSYKYKNKKVGKYTVKRGGAPRKFKSATYERVQNKNRKKLVKSTGSNPHPRLNLKEREQELAINWGQNRDTFLKKLKRRRTVNTRGTRTARTANTQIYNENRPLYDAHKRLSKSKTYLDRGHHMKPTKLSQLPDDLLYKIFGEKKKKKIKRKKTKNIKK